MEARKLIPKALSRRRSKSLRKDGSSAPGSPNKDANSLLEPSDARGRRRTSTRHNGSSRGSSINRDLGEDDPADAKSVSSMASSSTGSHRPSTSPHPTRPGIPSAHPSLIGYLTTSSPAIQAAHLDTSSSSTGYRQPSPSGRSPSAKHTTSSSEAAATQSPELAVPAKTASRFSNPPSVKITTETPRTPPSGDKPAPTIISTPPTPVEPFQASAASSPDKRSPWGGKLPTRGGSPTRSSTFHNRTKSGSSTTVVPSKLSHSTTLPTTPTPDAVENSNAGGGFFSSVFSAAQNAATTLTSIPGTNITLGNRKSSSIPKSQSLPASSDLAEPESLTEPSHDDDMERPKGSAVQTLGTGELSLSQLGLAEPGSNVVSPASLKFPEIVDTRLRSESAPVESAHADPPSIEDLPGSRPRSLLDAPSGDERVSTPEPDPKAAGIQRTSSVRSAMKSHRGRGSSVTTGAIIAAGVAGAMSNNQSLSVPKLTGFAIASKKRNRDFHSFFKSVPDDDYLIEDYSCALQREILAHGRLYVSEGHLCFSSNILGWTTTLVMSFDEIVSVEKRSTALVFKNGLMISTLHAKHIFASFTSRDATYDLIVNIWKLGHPTLKSSLNGVQLEGTGGDKTEKIDAEPDDELGIDANSAAGSDSEASSDEDDDDEFYEEDDMDGAADTEPTEVSTIENEREKPVSRKVSSMTTNGAAGDAEKDAPGSPGLGADFPGPATHAPTDCGDAASHYDKFMCDEIIPAPLGKVYHLLFGAGSTAWLSKFLSNDQKCWDITLDDKKGINLDNKTRTYTYMKPLPGSFGPKQTKCVVSETIDTLDFEKSINISGSSTTPEVPSGNVFAVKTKYCLSWAEKNSTRLQINCTVEWSGKSWIKGIIEKSVEDGQGSYCRELAAAVKAAVSARGRASTLTKSKKKSRKSKANSISKGADENDSKKVVANKSNWGPLEPARSLLEPLLDILKPAMTGNVMYGLLVGLLVASWFGFGFSPNRYPNQFSRESDMYGSDRMSAFEEMWRREDSQLWDWLEERSGLERLGSEALQIRKRAMEPQSVEERLREARMDERDVQEAIRVTEEKLKVLRQVVSHGKQDVASDGQV